MQPGVTALGIDRLRHPGDVPITEAAAPGRRQIDLSTVAMQLELTRYGLASLLAGSLVAGSSGDQATRLDYPGARHIRLCGVRETNLQQHRRCAHRSTHPGQPEPDGGKNQQATTPVGSTDLDSLDPVNATTTQRYRPRHPLLL